LRDCGAITDKTHIAPIHLSHRNPSVNALQKRLRDMGARLPFDGDVIRL
jgi:hypothetical protein